MWNSDNRRKRFLAFGNIHDGIYDSQWADVCKKRKWTSEELEEHKDSIDFERLMVNPNVTFEQFKKYRKEISDSNRNYWNTNIFSIRNTKRFLKDNHDEFIKLFSKNIDWKKVSNSFRLKDYQFMLDNKSKIEWDSISFSKFNDKKVVLDNLANYSQEYDFRYTRSIKSNSTWGRIFSAYEFTIEELEKIANSGKVTWGFIAKATKIEKDDLFVHFNEIVDSLKLSDTLEVLLYLHKETLEEVIDDGLALLIAMY